ncbi:MAG: hypothetical protein V4692_05680 [Bdellovibrionota bacterium]
MFRKLTIWVLASIWLFASVPAFALPQPNQTESFMLTFKGKVSVTSLAQVMANRYGVRVDITRAKLQIRSRVEVDNQAKTQKFLFSAIIDKKHEARCAFVRSVKGDLIVCKSKTMALRSIRIDWKHDLLR